MGMAEGRAARPSKTRARILAACRELFNARGLAEVTTAEMAAAAGIAEGNLHYHFQRKEQLVEALFGEFEEALAATATADLVQGDDLRRSAGYLKGWFRLMWDWRFFYRDGPSVVRIAPSLRPRIHRLTADGQRQISRAITAMREAGILRVPATETDRLVVNAWIVSAYWIDYLRTRHGVAEITREHVDRGASQLFGLFVPYLDEKGRRLAADAGLLPGEGVAAPPASAPP